MATGQVSPENIPQNSRWRVLQEAQKRGVIILSDTQRNNLDALGRSEVILGTLTKQLEPLFGIMPLTPPSRFTLGTKTTIEKLLQTNPDVALYEDTKKAMLATLARSLGEKGVLTDLDIARVKSALPQVAWEGNRPPDTQEVARRKIETLNGLIKEFQARAKKLFWRNCKPISKCFK